MVHGLSLFSVEDTPKLANYETSDIAVAASFSHTSLMYLRKHGMIVPRLYKHFTGIDQLFTFPQQLALPAEASVAL